MKILLTGGAGVLGSNIASLGVKLGHEVKVIEIVRPEEAWRLQEIMGEISYVWKATNDIIRDDLKNVDIIFDCAIGSADRPFGSFSSCHVTYGNLIPPLHLLEAVRRIENKKRPLLIYPSSFNALYGYGDKKYHENLLPNPTTLYGWTKASVELLYLTYHRAYGIPAIITRTASAFGPKGRSDELPHKLIIYSLKRSKEFYLRSPEAKRLWTYVKDILIFYDKLLGYIEDSPNELNGMILHVAGNKGDEIIENLKLAEKIKKLTNTDMKIINDEYEPGEVVNGKPISFDIECLTTRKILKWVPKYTIEEGLKETINWFKDNLWRYTTR